MSDHFDRAEEARERNEGLHYEEYHERDLAMIHEYGEPGWCPKCSREVTPYQDDKCPVCGTLLEELGTGDDAPYPIEEEEHDPAE